jgi:hypothetical protein
MEIKPGKKIRMKSWKKIQAINKQMRKNGDCDSDYYGIGSFHVKEHAGKWHEVKDDWHDCFSLADGYNFFWPKEFFYINDSEAQS